MTRQADNSADSVVAIEVRPSTLSMAIVGPAGRDDRRPVRTRSIRWREDASSLRSEAGKWELGKALKALATEERLSGADARMTLSGKYCVTRVVTGSTERVKRELALLRERSDLYLSLGPERKKSVTSIHELDARHQHALLSVANGETLDAAVQAAAGAGLAVEVVEPTLVALCRLLGATGEDSDGPVLIIDLTESGMELGISYRGRLLLDHRPGGRFALEGVADTVLQHLARLDRYCEHHYRYARGPLKRVYLCGESAAVESAAAQFGRQKALGVQILRPKAVDPTWDFGAAAVDPACCPALGTCLRPADPKGPSEGPNLREPLHAEAARPLLSKLCRSLWPAAAAVAIALGLFAASWYEHLQCRRLSEDIEVLETSAAELWDLRREMAEADTKTAHLRAIAEEVTVQPWATILSGMARCMPADVWLEKVATDSEGKVTLTGSSYLEASIYQFADHLKSSPTWSYAAVSGTWPASTRQGRLTRFDIECEFDDHASGTKESSPDD